MGLNQRWDGILVARAGQVLDQSGVDKHDLLIRCTGLNALHDAVQVKYRAAHSGNRIGARQPAGCFANGCRPNA